MGDYALKTQLGDWGLGGIKNIRGFLVDWICCHNLAVINIYNYGSTISSTINIRCLK